MSKLSILREFWNFLKVRKKWWLAPIIIFLVLTTIFHTTDLRECVTWTWTPAADDPEARLLVMDGLFRCPWLDHDTCHPEFVVLPCDHTYRANFPIVWKQVFGFTMG